MVSMKDIARECGVSVATVSKALNDYSDIGEATRKKVRDTAERLGYFPNSSARALKTNKTYNLGVLFVDKANSGLTHDFFAHILESFKVTAEKRGYDITFVTSNIASRKTSYLEHCRYRGVDGVVIACIDFYDPRVQDLVQSSLPVVTIDHVFDSRIAVTSNNVKGMHDLVEYVLSRGHRRIAYVHGADSSVTRNRLASFYHTLELHGVTVPESYICESAYRDVRGAEAVTEHLLDLPEPPTCILYPDDISCVGGMNEIRERGLRIPEDISIAGFDGLLFSKLLIPAMTTISQDTDTIGRIAAEKLINQIENPKATIVETIVVDGTLVEGGTVAQIGPAIPNV
ncbi:MAG: LacI family transcriptional regulator [Lachnospiraceae bacterium]|nr:LacI family transcriptional regulator [Lachnospiraceae bacterium]